ncbi:MAG TPA: 30S ribosomal protein S4 [Candidatus Babeliaceae bacterium]|nr:30S ribosomal protein S4 [Candidatus Babeliaceae bacterium]
MERKTANPGRGSSRLETDQKSAKRTKKLTEYGRQLQEKKKVKLMYGLRERQFRRFFDIATKSQEATGETLLSLLERRLDNIIFRLKFASTRAQARQMVTHGHVFVNGKRVYSPSYLVSVNDEISFAPQVSNKAIFIEQVIDKRLNSGVKVPEWLELDKKYRKGRVLRNPVRADIQAAIDEYLIVEFYSK